MYLIHGVGTQERNSNEKSPLYRQVFATDRERQISRKSNQHAYGWMINVAPFACAKPWNPHDKRKSCREIHEMDSISINKTMT